MKVYELKPKTKVYCECDDGSKFVTFNGMDGSWANVVSENNGRSYLHAMTELEKHKDGYKLIATK